MFQWHELLGATAARVLPAWVCKSFREGVMNKMASNVAARRVPRLSAIMVAIAAALAAAGGAPFAAHAQDAGGSSARDADQAKTIEAVSVAGSRIRRQAEPAASPVFTLERDEIEATSSAERREGKGGVRRGRSRW